MMWIILFVATAFSNDQVCELAVENLRIKYEAIKEENKITTGEISDPHLLKLLATETNRYLNKIPMSERERLLKDGQKMAPPLHKDPFFHNFEKINEQRVSIEQRFDLESEPITLLQHDCPGLFRKNICYDTNDKPNFIDLTKARKDPEVRRVYSQGLTRKDVMETHFYCLTSPLQKVASPIDCLKNDKKVSVARISNSFFKAFYNDGIMKDKGPVFTETCLRVYDFNKTRPGQYEVSDTAKSCFSVDLIKRPTEAVVNEKEISDFLIKQNNNPIFRKEMPTWHNFYAPQLFSTGCSSHCWDKDDCDNVVNSDREKGKIIPEKTSPNNLKKTGAQSQ